MFEEWRSGPNPGVRIPMTVYNAMKEDKFLPIAELDEGFVRPTYEEQVIVSYMQAGLVCQFIDRRFGADKLRELLYAFGEGLLTAEAVESVMEMPPTEFDRQFADFVDSEHGERSKPVRGHLEGSRRQGEEGRGSGPQPEAIDHQ